jgi:hypothetical protein
MCWSHRTTRCYHLLGTLHWFRTYALGWNWFLRQFLATGICWLLLSWTHCTHMSVALVWVPSTASSHWRVDGLLFWSRSRSRLLWLCIKTALTWWFLLASILRRISCHSLRCLVWWNITTLTRPYLLHVSRISLGSRLILVVIVEGSHMTVRWTLFYRRLLSIFIDKVVIAWRIAPSHQLLLILLLLLLAWVHYLLWRWCRLSLNRLLCWLLWPRWAWSFLFFRRALVDADICWENAAVHLRLLVVHLIFRCYSASWLSSPWLRNILLREFVQFLLLIFCLLLTSCLCSLLNCLRINHEVVDFRLVL